ncbi:MAG: site-specific integrase [Thermoguttaceae bacterium]|jgi:integrase|nr:site-specific integrase [Thermoguttaceae bacterium]
MPTPEKTTRVPKYRKHANGQAIVSIRGKRIYLGKHNTPESRERYAAEIRKLNLPAPAYKPVEPPGPDYTVVELAAAYLDHAEGYYRKHGEPTETLGEVKRSLTLLSDHYGDCTVAEFGPLKLTHLQSVLVAGRLARSTVNDRIRIIQRAFRWGTKQELVPPGVYHGLAAVEGLRKGRTEVKEAEPVLPVDDEVVDVTLPFLSPVVADMIRFQRYTGARPGEVCAVRPGDVDRSGEIWTYVPGRHKGEHHGRRRIVCIGPKAQAILQRYLLRPADAYCFSPRESEEKRLAALHEQRKTPLSCGNAPGSNRRRWPRRRAGSHYTTHSYRRAVERAVEKLNAHLVDQAEKAGDPAPEPVPTWAPNQLRHSAGTEIRKKFGLEAAQVTLGHAKANVTEVYAERDLKLATEVAKRIG